MAISRARIDVDLAEPLPEELPTAGRAHWWAAGGSFAALIALWEAVCVWREIAPHLLPRPSAIWRELVANFDVLLYHAWVTTAEVLAGFVIAVVIGIVLAIGVDRSKVLSAIIHPYVIVLQATPKVALAPFLVIWFGFGITSKVFIAALIVFFPLLENTVLGLRSVNPDELTLFKSLRASTWQVFVKLRLPHAMPLIFTGLRVASVFAVIGAVVGEYIGANKGLGALVIITQGQSNTALLFGVLIMLTLMAWGFYLLVDVIGRLLLRGEQRVTYGGRQG